MCVPFHPGSPRSRRGRRSGLVGAVLGCWVVAHAAAAQAAGTFYVEAQNPLASDSGPGTESRPFRTISGAIAVQRGPAVTILVKPGIYREQVSIPASGTSSSP